MQETKLNNFLIMGKYISFTYHGIYKRLGELKSETIHRVGKDELKDEMINEDYIKSSRYDFVVLEKTYIKQRRDRYYADYEIFQNGKKQDIVVNGWTFPSEIGKAHFEWNYGFVHDYECVSPNGNKHWFYRIGIHDNTDRMPVVYLFNVFEYISKFNDDDALLVVPENLQYYEYDQNGMISSNLEKCEKLKQSIEDHESNSDCDEFVLKELKSAYRHRRARLLNSVKDKYPEYKDNE